MAFETDLIRRYSGAFSKEDCTRIIEGIHFFEKIICFTMIKKN